MKMIGGLSVGVLAAFTLGCTDCDSGTDKTEAQCACEAASSAADCHRAPLDPPPPQGAPSARGELIDEAAVAMAVGGTYAVDYGAYGHAVTVAATGDGFGATVKDARTIEVTAATPGIGRIDVTDATGLGTTPVAVEAAVVARAIVDAPFYRALGETPTAYLGPAVTGAVRLVDAQGRILADDTLAIHASWATAERDQLTATAQVPGPRTLTVSASSLDGGAARTLGLTVVDAVDDLVLEADQRNPTFVRVCGHAMRQGDEVFARWTFEPPSNRAGNCVDIDRGRTGAFAVRGQAGGLTREITITAGYQAASAGPS
jgi:hypothetical protein